MGLFRENKEIHYIMEIIAAEYLGHSNFVTAHIAGIKVKGNNPRTVTGVAECFWDPDVNAWAVDSIDIDYADDCEAMYAAILATYDKLAPDFGPIAQKYWQQIARLACH